MDAIGRSELAYATDSPVAYNYDAQGRVTSMTPGSNSADNYQLDPSDNLLTLPDGGTGTYDHAGELTSAATMGITTNYSYNADGQRLAAVQRGTTAASATWDGAGRLTAYQNAGATMSASTYDGTGMRTSAVFTPAGGSAVTEGYVWNGDRLLMDSGEAYVYAGDGSIPAEQVNLATGAITYLVTDLLGSVRGTVDATGALTGTTSYDAWGNPESAAGLVAVTPFGFAGGYTDPNGLIYLVNRYYDPAAGQFISVDPEVSTTAQPYAYAGADPVNAKDPDGLATIGFCLGGSMSVGKTQLKGIFAGVGGCLVRTLHTGSDDIGVTGLAYVSVGIGKGLGSVGAYVEISNAKKLQQLSGLFEYISASVDLGEYGATALYFWGGGIIGIDIGPSFGPQVNFVPHGTSYTWVDQFHNMWQANGARLVWNAVISGTAFGQYISFSPILIGLAKWAINHRRR